MKIIFTSLFCISCLFLTSFKNPPKNAKVAIATQLCVNQEEEEFVELMDGKIIKGKVSKCNLFKTNSFKAKGSGEVVIDGVKYEYNDVMAVQHKKNRYKKMQTENLPKERIKVKLVFITPG